MTAFPLRTLLGLCAAAAFAPAPAAAETVNCMNIASLPTTLTVQGVYCLKQDVATSIASGAAIRIAANNITLDCNGFKIGGLGAGPETRAIGIDNVDARINATVRGCNVRGFHIGLALQGDGHLVEDNRFDGNTVIGMLVYGDASVIRRNRIYATGGGNPPGWTSIGLYTISSTDVSDNTVAGVFAKPGSGEGAFGIYTWQNLDGAVVRNHVSGVQGDGAVSTYAIRNDYVGQLSLRDNTVSDGGTGIAAGIFCSSGDASADGNHVLGFEFGISGCHQGSGNTTF